MSKRSRYILAAAAWGSLAVGGLVLAQDQQDRQPPSGTDTTADDNSAASRAEQNRKLDNPNPARAATPKGSGEASDEQLVQVRRVLAQATDAALSENGLERLSALLSRKDQQRIRGHHDQRQDEDARSDKAQGDQPGGDSAAFEKRVRQFRQDWKEKYGQDFSLKNDEVVFSGARIDAASGDDRSNASASATETAKRDDASDEHAQPAGGRVKSDRGAERSKPGDAEEPKSGEVQAAADEKDGAIPSQSKLSADATARNSARNSERNSAPDDARDAHHDADDADGAAAAAHGQEGHGKSLAVIVPPPRGAQDVHLRLVSEGRDAWRIDLPDAVDRAQLLAGLGRHLEAVQRERDNWPDNPDDAARLVSQHILMALAETKQPSDERSGNAAGAAETAR